LKLINRTDPLGLERTRLLKKEIPFAAIQRKKENL
jgi:hypothetical protein